jgi:hypothetical protein
MKRDVTANIVGWRSLGLATIVLVATAAGSPAARDAAARRPGPRIVLASEWALFRSDQWIQVSSDPAGGKVYDLELDLLTREMGRRGRVVLDREGLAAAVQAALGPEAVLDDMRVADLLRDVRRVRVRFQGMTIPLGQRALRRLLNHFAGYDWPIEDMPLSALFERLSGLELGAQGAPGWLDEPTVSALLGRNLGKFQRSERVRDPDRERRRTFALQYDQAVGAVRKAEREFAGTREATEHLYDHAYDVLAADGQLDAVPLLELHLQLEQELERTTFKSMTLAERIANRVEARRRIYGDDLTNLLFTREEAIERYEIDRLNLEANPELSARQKARGLSARRTALKVELAKQGIYVGFPDESPGRRQFSRVPDVEAAIQSQGDAGQEEVR